MSHGLTPEHLAQIPYHVGPLDAKLCFVGEAPGLDEVAHEFKHPFVGKSGQWFRTWLQQVGINFNDCYVTNLLKERPPRNRFAPFVKENPKLLEAHTELLAAELSLLTNCNLIVPLGTNPLLPICGKQGIMAWRGSILPATLSTIKGKKCIPTLHPAGIMRQWKTRISFMEDLKRIKDDTLFSEFRLPVRNYIIRPKFEQVIEFLTRLLDEKKPISVDTETRPGGIIASIQFCNDTVNALCIPFQYKNGNSYWPLDQEILIWELVRKCLYELSVIGQNFIKFDMFILWANGIDPYKILKNFLVDTLEGFACIQPELPKSLAYLTSIFTREPFFKAEGKEGKGKEWAASTSENAFWTYGCKDVLVDHEIAPQVIKELKDEKLWEFYMKRFQGMAKRRLAMSFKGIRLDEEKRKELRGKVGRRAIEYQCKLSILTDRPLNVKSNPQMKKLLYEDMKCKKQWKLNDKGDMVLTCDEDAVLKLSAMYPSKVFDLVLKVRHERTIMSNYILVKTDSDGHVRSTYGFAETGRFTSSKSPMGTGYNLQNWPRDMRVMLRSDDDDHVLIEMDLAQAEARVVAWKSRATKLIQEFLDGVDYHVTTACNVFDLSAEKIFYAERYTGKRVNHASNYDMKSDKFAMVYNKDAAENGVELMGIERARIVMSKHHDANPHIHEVYHKELRAEVSKEKKLWNIFGRRMVFLDRLGPDLYREAYGWYAQSTVADLTNVIFDRVADKIMVINQGHDSLLVHCHKSKVKETVKYMYENSQITLKIGGRDLIIPVDFKIGTHWGTSMKEYEYKEAACVS